MHYNNLDKKKNIITIIKKIKSPTFEIYLDVLQLTRLELWQNSQYLFSS